MQAVKPHATQHLGAVLQEPPCQIKIVEPLVVSISHKIV